MKSKGWKEDYDILDEKMYKSTLIRMKKCDIIH